VDHLDGDGGVVVAAVAGLEDDGEGSFPDEGDHFEPVEEELADQSGSEVERLSGDAAEVALGSVGLSTVGTPAHHRHPSTGNPGDRGVPAVRTFGAAGKPDPKGTTDPRGTNRIAAAYSS
jgi:hypothetical protein